MKTYKIEIHHPIDNQWLSCIDAYDSIEKAIDYIAGCIREDEVDGESGDWGYRIKEID